MRSQRGRRWRSELASASRSPCGPSTDELDYRAARPTLLRTCHSIRMPGRDYGPGVSTEGDRELQFGYFFTDRSPTRLSAFAKAAEELGYRAVALYKDDEP